jgi:hypothetical protein
VLLSEANLRCGLIGVIIAASIGPVSARVRGQPPWRTKHTVNCCPRTPAARNVGDTKFDTLLIETADRDLRLVDRRAAGRPDLPAVVSDTTESMWLPRSGCDLPTLSFQHTAPEATLIMFAVWYIPDFFLGYQTNSRNQSNQNWAHCRWPNQAACPCHHGVREDLHTQKSIRTVVGGNRCGPCGPCGRARPFRAPQGPTRGRRRRRGTEATVARPTTVAGTARRHPATGPDELTDKLRPNSAIAAMSPRPRAGRDSSGP